MDCRGQTIISLQGNTEITFDCTSACRKLYLLIFLFYKWKRQKL